MGCPLAPGIFLVASWWMKTRMNDNTCVSLLGLIKKTIGSSLLKKSESKNHWFWLLKEPLVLMRELSKELAVVWYFENFGEP
jgi:hypothetical protein